RYIHEKKDHRNPVDHSCLCWRRRHDTHENPTWFQDAPRTLPSLAADRVDYDVNCGYRLFEPGLTIVHDRIGAQAPHIVDVLRTRGRNHSHSRVPGQLHSVRAYVARASVDQDGLSGGDAGIVKKHLPGRD